MFQLRIIRFFSTAGIVVAALSASLAPSADAQAASESARRAPQVVDIMSRPCRPIRHLRITPDLGRCLPYQPTSTDSTFSPHDDNSVAISKISTARLLRS